MKSNQTLKIQDRKFSLKKVISILAIAILLTSGISYVVFSQTSFTPPDIHLDALPSTASYVIDTDGTNYWATNENGQIESGMSGTNATQVWENAKDSIATTGGVIHFRKGVYNFSSTMQMVASAGNNPQWITIQGEGAGTQLNFSAAVTAIQIEGQSAFGAGGPYHITIRDLALTTPKTTNMTRGIYVKNWFGLTLENLIIAYASDAAIYLEDSAGIRLQNIYTVDCQGESLEIRGSRDILINQYYSDTDNIGVYMDISSASNKPTKIKITNLEVSISKSKGVAIWQSSDVEITNLIVEGAGSHGVEIGDSERISLTSGEIISAGDTGILVQTSSVNLTYADIKITDILVYQSENYGVRLYSGNGNPLKKISVDRVSVLNSGQSSANSYDGISITNDTNTNSKVWNVTILNSFIGNRPSQTKTQRDGVRSEGASDNVVIAFCRFFQNLGADINLVGTNNVDVYNEKEP